MSETADQTESPLLRVLGALAEPRRLRMAAALSTSPCTLDELAHAAGVSGATAVHHLKVLERAGLVSKGGHGAAVRYSIQTGALRSASARLARLEGQSPPQRPREYRDRVISIFFEGERLRRMPAQERKRRIVLEHVAERFSADERLPERDVNSRLLPVSDDVASLRRALVDNHLLERQQGVYWSAQQPREQPAG
jgi:hypothetical protein